MMNKNSIRDYLSYPLMGFLYLLSFLPFWILYGFSAFLSFLLHRVFRYRLNIVRQNLRNSFPGKTEKELRAIEKMFYRNFSDIMVEVVKFKTIPISSLKQRCHYPERSIELLNNYYDQGRSVMIVMGHMGNWEWAGASYPLYNKHKVLTAYRPLRNKIFDKDTLKMRQRTGNLLASMKNLPREMIKQRNQVTATALIADQTPSPDNAFWIKFLHQETPFFRGTELLSQKFSTPVFWGSVRRIKRGYYQIELELITENPSAFEKPGSLTCLFASYLERDISAQPESWLWSHRRWKHQRPEKAQLGCVTQKLTDIND
ncbi:MAG: lipid A biosynthesis acyltransferase [Bacteroidetes bacterium]|nr:MAG: lipid A biosynthesis acyltransferase [Bacteroidota bacterium]